MIGRDYRADWYCPLCGLTHAYVMLECHWGDKTAKHNPVTGKVSLHKDTLQNED